MAKANDSWKENADGTVTATFTTVAKPLAGMPAGQKPTVDEVRTGTWSFAGDG